MKYVITKERSVYVSNKYIESHCVFYKIEQSIQYQWRIFLEVGASKNSLSNNPLYETILQNTKSYRTENSSIFEKKTKKNLLNNKKNNSL